MIGQLQFNHDGRSVTAALTRRLLWECEDKQMEDLLNTACSASNVALGTEESGELGQQVVIHHLYQVGARLGARVSLH